MLRDKMTAFLPSSMLCLTWGFEFQFSWLVYENINIILKSIFQQVIGLDLLFSKSFDIKKAKYWTHRALFWIEGI